MGLTMQAASGPNAGTGLGAVAAIGYVTELSGASRVAVAFAPGDTIMLNGATWIPTGSGVAQFDCSQWRSRQIAHTRDNAVTVIPEMGQLVPGSSGVPVVAAYGGTAGSLLGSTTISGTAGLNVPAGVAGIDCTGLAGVVAFINAESGAAFSGGEAIWWRQTPAGVWHRDNGDGTPLRIGATKVYLRDELVTVGTSRMYLDLSALTGPTTVRVDLVGVAR